MTAFANSPDKFVMDKLGENFAFLTGERLPFDKGKSKNAGGKTPEEWFHELSPLHLFIFVNAFHEANKRGLMNPGEKALCQEVMDIINEDRNA